MLRLLLSNSCRRSISANSSSRSSTTVVRNAKRQKKSQLSYLYSNTLKRNLSSPSTAVKVTTTTTATSDSDSSNSPTTINTTTETSKLQRSGRQRNIPKDGLTLNDFTTEVYAGNTVTWSGMSAGEGSNGYRVLINSISTDTPAFFKNSSPDPSLYASWYTTLTIPA